MKGSTVKEHCIVGDFSRVLDSTIDEYVRIDRNNLVQRTAIGRFSYTGNFTVIQSATIGAFCSISWGVTIGGGEHDYKRITTHDFIYNPRYELGIIESSSYDRYGLDCILGSDVWIGANSTVLRGVRIGHGAVVGANSTVTEDIPDYGIAVGSPAKVIKFRFHHEIIRQLLDLQWWTLDLDTIRRHFRHFQHDDVAAAIREIQRQ